MLCAQQLCVSAGSQRLLDGVDLEVGAGECAVVLGRNGAGKTTLLRALLGLLPSDGTVAVGGTPVGELSPRARAGALGWLPQALGLAEPVRVLELVASGRYRFGEGRQQRTEAARRATAEVGIASLDARLVHTLSGGERQRVALASLVAQEAAMWLLDEPASHLDPGVQEHVYRFLVRQWREGRGMVLVTHDPDLLLRVLEPSEHPRVRVLGLDAGRCVLDTSLADPLLPERVGTLLGVRMCWVDVGERRALVVVGSR